jgi:Na+/alanine symporter
MKILSVFLFLQFYSVFLISLGKDTFLDLVWDFTDKMLAIMQCIKQ